MSKNQGIKLIITPLFILAIFGCFPEMKKEVIGAKKETVFTPILSANIIDRKIAYLNTVLETKKVTDEDREIALNLLSAYKKIRSASQEKLQNREPFTEARLDWEVNYSTRRVCHQTTHTHHLPNLSNVTLCSRGGHYIKATISG